MKVFLGIIFFFVSICLQGQIKTPTDAMNKFDTFKRKEKFIKDKISHYAGVKDKNLRKTLSEKINLVADDFIELAKSGHVSEKAYQDKIKEGLERFREIKLELDTEDREKICLYVEELMDIVGLESSGGYLNLFMYGFDPTLKN